MSRVALGAVVLSTLSLFSSPARAEHASWAVLPIQCPAPPPADPTLLRLTKELASALHDVVGGDVRIVSRDERDDRCPDEEGVCPRDIAATLDADRVLGLVLARGYKSMHVRVYRERSGLEREGELDCRWESGNVSCETGALAALLGSEEKSPPLDRAKVEAAFDAFRPKLDRCRSAKADEGEEAAASAVSVDEGWISFRARPDGHVVDVRIDPRELEASPVARCMARTVESFEVARFAGTKPVAFRFPIDPEKAKKVTTKTPPPKPKALKKKKPPKGPPPKK